MRRAIAAVALLQFVLLASGVSLVRTRASCCCVMKSGASCPLRSQHCTAGGRACSMDSGAAATTVREPTMHAVVVAALRLEPRREWCNQLSIPGGRAATHSVPPETPPPRTA